MKVHKMYVLSWSEFTDGEVGGDIVPHSCVVSNKEDAIDLAQNDGPIVFREYFDPEVLLASPIRVEEVCFRFSGGKMIILSQVEFFVAQESDMPEPCSYPIIYKEDNYLTPSF